MLNAKDLELLAKKGISEQQINEQLACFVKGFPFLDITASASVEKGIQVVPQEKQAAYMEAWDGYLAKNKKILKFVPASGAASRMFKNLYAFLAADYDVPQSAFEKQFFGEIQKFAFYNALNKACVQNYNRDIPALLALDSDGGTSGGRRYVRQEQCWRSEHPFHRLAGTPGAVRTAGQGQNGDLRREILREI